MKITNLRKNAIFNVLGWFLPVIIFIFITPLLIDNLGTEAFGVVTLIQLVTGYMTVLNFGFSEAIIKQIAENRLIDPQRAFNIAWAGLIIFTVVGLIGGISLYILSDWLCNSLFKISEYLRKDSANALRIGSYIFFLQMIAEYYRGLAIGWERFDIPNISRIIRVLLSAIFIVIAITGGGGITEVMHATLLGLVIGLILNIVWMQYISPARRIRGEFKNVFVELFHFSKHIFAVRIAGLIATKFSQFLLGTLSSVANVALYEIPTRAAEAGSAMLNRIMQVFYPGFSSLYKSNDKDKVKKIILSVLSVQMLFTVPITTVVLLEGETLISFWINKEIGEQSSIILGIVAISYLVSSLTNIPTFAALGFSRPDIVSKYSFYRAIISMVVAYPLVKFYGLVGAAITLLTGSLIGILFIHRVMIDIFAINIFVALRRQIIVHFTISTTIIIVYTELYKRTDWYSPYSVFIVLALYMVAAMSFKATSTNENRRIMELLGVWR